MYSNYNTANGKLVTVQQMYNIEVYYLVYKKLHCIYSEPNFTNI